MNHEWSMARGWRKPSMSKSKKVEHIQWYIILYFVCLECLPSKLVVFFALKARKFDCFLKIDLARWSITKKENGPCSSYCTKPGWLSKAKHSQRNRSPALIEWSKKGWKRVTNTHIISYHKKFLSVNLRYQASPLNCLERWLTFFWILHGPQPPNASCSSS